MQASAVSQAVYVVRQCKALQFLLCISICYALSDKPLGFKAPKLEFENQGIITCWKMARGAISLSGDAEIWN